MALVTEYDLKNPVDVAILEKMVEGTPYGPGGPPFELKMPPPSKKDIAMLKRKKDEDG